MTESSAGPFLVVTSILDSAARAAAITRCHGEAMERAISATEGRDIAGLDVVELPIAPQAHAALRKHLGFPDEQAGVYDVFPLSPTIDPAVRTAAAQFLAAEVLWTLDSQGSLGGVPLTVKLDLPADWDKDPKKVHERLMAAGALELSPDAIETFRTIKERWSAAG